MSSSVTMPSNPTPQPGTSNGAERAQGFVATPLLAYETPPLRPSLLDFNPTQRHMENLDALRILAMLVIIVTHVTQPYLDTQAPSAEICSEQLVHGAFYKSIFSVNVGLRFGVPCFMMISFFIYWHQFYDKGRTWGELLKRRLKRLVPAFLVWSLIYFGLHKVLNGIHLNVDPGPLGDDPARLNWKNPSLWAQILLQGKAHEHLYYLPLVICTLLLIPLLRLLWKRPAVAWGWIGLTVAAWAFMGYAATFAPARSKPAHIAYLLGVVTEYFLALPFLVFALMGMMCAGQVQWRRFITHTPTGFWVGLLIFGLALHLSETMVLLPHNWPFALSGLKVGRFITAVPIFVLVIRHPLMKDPFPKVSHHAFGLHFMHPIIIIALTILEGKLMGINPMEFWESASGWMPLAVTGLLILNLTLTFYITFGLCLLVGRVKWLEFLVV